MSVLELEYQRADDVLLSDAKEDPQSAPAAAIEHTFFVVPMRFVVSGENLIRYPGVFESWRPLPLLGFASRLCDVAFTLRQRGREKIFLADGGELELTGRGKEIGLHAALSGVEATVDAHRLRDAAADLLEDACSYVLELVPAMSEHPFWQEWTRSPTRR